MFMLRCSRTHRSTQQCAHRALLTWRRVVPTAVLSRQTGGLRGKALILNLPGKPKAIRETIDEVRSASVAAIARSLQFLLMHS